VRPSIEPRSSTARSDTSSWSSRGEQRLDRGRNLDLPAAGVAHEREHLLEEERIPFGHLHDPLA
jgi:hypothetical protein